MLTRGEAPRARYTEVFLARIVRRRGGSRARVGAETLRCHLVSGPRLAPFPRQQGPHGPCAYIPTTGHQKLRRQTRIYSQQRSSRTMCLHPEYTRWVLKPTRAKEAHFGKLCIPSTGIKSSADKPEYTASKVLTDHVPTGVVRVPSETWRETETETDRQ